MFQKIVSIVFISFVSYHASSQHVMGTVYELNASSKEVPLPDANVYFLGTNTGTTTDESGMFHLDRPNASAEWLIISYTGYLSDTIKAEGTNMKVILKKAITLDVVTVDGQSDSYISTLNPLKTEKIGQGELENNACCNLSESFENNPTVDVSFSDAVTGARQIQLLGLAGKYAQIMTDVLPTIRGLGITYGFNQVPGPWVESIYVSKGTGSVVNGYESITGQIDIELRKPEESEKLYVNLFGNTEQRFEANIYGTQKLTPKWSTMTLLHGNIMQHHLDENNDGFLDQPLSKGLSAMHRWKFDSKRKMESMFGVKALIDEREGGQHNDFLHHPLDSLYLIDVTTKRIEGFMKTSFGWTEREYQSLGFQFTPIYHNVATLFGNRHYRGEESSVYFNSIFLSIFGSTKHKFKTGVSFLYDYYLEVFEYKPDTSFWPFQVRHEDHFVPGTYFEYTFDDLTKLTIVAGLRGDLFIQSPRPIFSFSELSPSSSSTQLFWSPRLHIKYKLAENSILRASGGKGYRIANIFAENPAYLASSREWTIAEYLRPEEAWNYGINFTQTFYTGPREGTFSIDLYRTDFINQVIADVDSDPGQIIFSNLHGQSYSNSIQAEISYEWIHNFNTKLAYKYYDVKETYNGILQQKPLVPRHRALLVLTYKSANKHWEFSQTSQWLGEQRLPATSLNPEEFRMPVNSPSYFRLLGQVTYLTKNWEFYVGGENLTDYVQTERIISPDDPFGPYFDTAIVWGPLTGRVFYGGLRFTLK